LSAPQGADLLDRLDTICCFTDDLDLGQSSQHLPQPIAGGAFVINQECPDQGLCLSPTHGGNRRKPSELSRLRHGYRQRD
jgi:hypothetical protein